MPPVIVHDKTPRIVSFLRPLILHHSLASRSKVTPTASASEPVPPFFLGISGIQGAGKTTLTTHLHKALTSEPYHLRVLTLSIDDLYLPDDQLTTLSGTHPTNPFLKQRGPPGTHDVRLGEQLYERLEEQDALVKVPAYDKSAYGGRGDRVPENLWKMEKGPWDVVILEGWCVGFTPVEEKQVERKWRESKETGQGTLGKHELENLVWLNKQLEKYTRLWEKFNALVHVDAEELEYVYEWRTQQEHNLIQLKGSGMTDEQVRAFVDNYMPSYELYLPGLRQSYDQDAKKKRPYLRFVVGRDRNPIITEIWGLEGDTPAGIDE